ncbi:N-acetylmannosamine kinase [Desulfomarina profundi]|uniref:N-acetylmannosamine kinase n=1 Tax=Desulfomarina profundi TaxID=2772557 RepID=A0A8D5FP28_9BACT|nr:MurR/RpiR family transcriptional regulator [Desulfomarina profundi]BCL61784.1 N-acetylmannosamine kinase [Desulfomarina profundi]
MTSKQLSLTKTIQEHYQGLTAKGKILADFIRSRPDKAVFMTTRQLAAEVGVSEATVVRFVRQLNFTSYSLLIDKLREHIDTELTLLDRSKLTQSVVHTDDELLQKMLSRNIEDIKSLSQSIDLNEIKKVRDHIKNAKSVHIIGSRLSYSLASHMSWTLGKLRPEVHLLKGSDTTCIDRLVFIDPDSVIVIIATTRYPNDLIKVGKLVRRQQLKMILLTESSTCPLSQISNHTLIASSTGIPYLGATISLLCLINYLVESLSAEMGEELQLHQQKLEQTFLENDLLFLQ